MNRPTEKQIAYEKMKRSLKESLIKELDMDKELPDEEIRKMIAERLAARESGRPIPMGMRKQLGKELFYAIRRLDMLQELLEDPSVTEIMINGKDNIFMEKDGRISRYPGSFESEEKLQDVVQQIVAGCNRVVNEASPIVDARLASGARVNVVLKPVALNGPIVTIRRFSEDPISMEKLENMGSITKEAGDFLKKLVKCRYNIFISGGTGSGKTTFLNALSQFIPTQERIITIEDSAELQLKTIENLVSLETRNANTEGCRPIVIRDLIRTSLRMRPDRVIVGEVRGGEALDLLQALNCGHSGSMSTGHANSARDMMSRLETMTLMGMELPIEAIRRQIASGLDIIVHLGRLRDYSRKVLEIAEIIGVAEGEIQLKTLYLFEEESQSTRECVVGKLVKKGELEHVEKLENAGCGVTFSL